jgi:hypothetical protein
MDLIDFTVLLETCDLSLSSKLGIVFRFAPVSSRPLASRTVLEDVPDRCNEATTQRDILAHKIGGGGTNREKEKEARDDRARQRDGEAI